MENPFDQFDEPAGTTAEANPFDQFDAPSAQPPKKREVRRFNPGESIDNADGTKSTELLMSVMGDARFNEGKPTNIPSLWMVDGKPYKATSEDEAIGLAMEAGGQWDSFGTIDEAVAAAKQRSAAGGRSQDAAPQFQGIGSIRPRPGSSLPAPAPVEVAASPSFPQAPAQSKIVSDVAKQVEQYETENPL